MMWHDPGRNVVVYDTPNAQPILERVTGSFRLSNGYVAAPVSLYNLQVLSWLGHSVPGPLNNGYEWPGPYTPFEAQRVTANFLAVNPRAFVLSDMGCVGGETLIDTAYGKRRIDELAAAGKPFPVRALTPGGPRFVEVAAPFQKGYADLFRVTFQSGRSIVVTKRHVFLTTRGWVSCEQLAISEQLPVFDVYRQQSSWAPCRVGSQLNAQHLSQIAASSRGHSEILSYDVLPLAAVNTSLELVPSLSAAPTRTHFSWRTDAQGNKYIRTDLSAGDPHSSRRCGVQTDQGEMGGFLSEYATKQTDNQFHISAQCHPFPSLLQGAPEDRGLRLCIPTGEASASPFDTVVHIAYERSDVYYDMEVPEHANYVAHGLCNHNTGKTLAALWAADYIMRQHKPGTCRALIVAPLSTLQRVWADAIFNNLLGLRSGEVVYGTADKRLASLKRDHDFYIINYDGLGIGAPTDARGGRSLYQYLAQREDIRIVIIDEASAYKDSTTRRHHIARKLLHPKPYLWLMTGTPTPNGPTDAYGLAKLVNNAHGESFTHYKQRVMFQASQFKWLPKQGASEVAKQMLQPAVRFAIEDCVDLPPCTTQRRDVELSDEQKVAYDRLKKDLVLTVKSGKRIDAVNEAVLRMKLIQLSAGAVYDANHDVHLLDPAPRIAALKEVIDQSAGKVIVFAPLTSVITMLSKALKEYPTAVINGQVSPKDRNTIFNDFQGGGKTRILLADPATMAHGLTLTAATTIVWYVPTEKTELYLQANKRIDRPGQKHPTTIVQLAATATEREIFRRLENNEAMQGAMLQMIREET